MENEGDVDYVDVLQQIRGCIIKKFTKQLPTILKEITNLFILFYMHNLFIEIYLSVLFCVTGFIIFPFELMPNVY